MHLMPAAAPRTRVPVAAVLLTTVYLAAIAVAVTAPGTRALAGLVVLAGLTARLVVRWRHHPSARPVPSPVATPVPTAVHPAESHATA